MSPELGLGAPALSAGWNSYLAPEGLAAQRAIEAVARERRQPSPGERERPHADLPLGQHLQLGARDHRRGARGRRRPRGRWADTPPTASGRPPARGAGGDVLPAYRRQPRGLAVLDGQHAPPRRLAVVAHHRADRDAGAADHHHARVVADEPPPPTPHRAVGAKREAYAHLRSSLGVARRPGLATLLEEGAGEHHHHPAVGGGNEERAHPREPLLHEGVAHPHEVPGAGAPGEHRARRRVVRGHQHAAARGGLYA